MKVGARWSVRYTADSGSNAPSARVRREPGVQSTSYSRGGPLAGTGGTISVAIEVCLQSATRPRRWGFTEVRVDAASSVAVVRVLRAWMYEMSVYDIPTFVAVTVLLCVVALCASWLPARWASHVDPMLALRAD